MQCYVGMHATLMIIAITCNEFLQAGVFKPFSNKKDQCHSGMELMRLIPTHFVATYVKPLNLKRQIDNHSLLII